MKWFSLKNGRKNCIIILVILTVISSITKVKVGLDIDECYNVVLATRLLQGEHLFREIWDLYQTTVFPMALVIGVYKWLFGSFTGVIFFTRIIATLIQWSLGLCVYFTFKNKYKNADFAGIMIANLIPKGIVNFEYSYLCCIFITFSMCLLYSACNSWGEVKSEKHSIIRIVASGVCYSFAILSYPTIIITVFVLGIFFLKSYWRQEKRWKIPLIFFLTCFISALVFVGYVLQFISLSELLDNTLNGILIEGSHSGGNLWNSLRDSLYLEREKRLQLIVLAIASFLPWILCVYKKCSIPFYIHLMLISSLVLLALNIFAIRPSGPLGFQIRLAMMVITGLATISIYHIKDNILVYLFAYMGVVQLIGILLGTNLTVPENAGNLGLSLIALVLITDELNLEYSIQKNYIHLAIIVFILSLIYVKGVLVRVDSTSPANIFEHRQEMEIGPMKRIYVYSDEAQYYRDCITQLEGKILKEDCVLVISDNPIMNMVFSAKYTTVTALTTPVYDEQWVKYYEEKRYQEPTLIVVDKKYHSDLELFLTETLFGKFLQDKYSLYEETKGLYFMR